MDIAPAYCIKKNPQIKYLKGNKLILKTDNCKCLINDWPLLYNMFDNWLSHRLEIKYPNMSVEQRKRLWNIRRVFMMTFLAFYMLYWAFDEPSNKILLIHAVFYAIAMKLIMYTVEQMFTMNQNH